MSSSHRRVARRACQRLRAETVIGATRRVSAKKEAGPRGPAARATGTSVTAAVLAAGASAGAVPIAAAGPVAHATSGRPIAAQIAGTVAVADVAAPLAAHVLVPFLGDGVGGVRHSALSLAEVLLGLALDLHGAIVEQVAGLLLDLPLDLVADAPGLVAELAADVTIAVMIFHKLSFG